MQYFIGRDYVSATERLKFNDSLLQKIIRFLFTSHEDDNQHGENNDDTSRKKT